MDAARGIFVPCLLAYLQRHHVAGGVGHTFSFTEKGRKALAERTKRPASAWVCALLKFAPNKLRNHIATAVLSVRPDPSSSLR